MANVNKIDIEGEQWDIEDTQARSLAEAAQETADEASALASETAQGLTTLENKAVTHTPNTATGSSIRPVYIKPNGETAQISVADTFLLNSNALVPCRTLAAYFDNGGAGKYSPSATQITGLPEVRMTLIFAYDHDDPSKNILFMYSAEDAPGRAFTVKNNGLQIVTCPTLGVVVMSGGTSNLDYKIVWAT